MSRAISSDVFHGLKSDRWNCADSALVLGRAELELHAELWGCTTWIGALPSNAMVCEGVHCLPIRCDALPGLKPVTPLQVCVGAGLKPVTPLRGENAGFLGVVGSQWCCWFHWSASGRRAVVLSVSLCSTLVPSVHWGRQGSGHGGDFALHEALRPRVTGVSRF